MSEKSNNLEELFWEAKQLDPGEDRERFLFQIATGDAKLADEIKHLLRQDARSDQVFGGLSQQANPGGLLEETMESKADGAKPYKPASRLSTASQIGPYKLLEPIGEGGMGLVYLAQQSEPVRRKVALKIIKPGMDSHQVIARFEAERQALAMMDHPNIAKVLDAGTTESGLPYFVMELVRGIPMTEYCDRAKMCSRARLELFQDACLAIQHAHNKGVIHRDIKPSNILVTEQDGKPLVKVIDFGVAKALTDNLTDKTLFTGMFQMLGTPLYMSPEQATLSNVDVDTRSDVYSLGVMLYQLLSGSLPINREEAEALTIEQLRQRICDTEPPRPSKRLSTLKDESETVAENRGIDVKLVHRVVTNELDWIVMKAIEKDRNRRYQSARDFAQDIQRFLDGDPVEACPPSSLYRLQKFANSHRSALIFSGLLLAAIFIGSALSIKIAIDAHRSELLAQRNEARVNIAAQKLRELLYSRDMTSLAKHYLEGDHDQIRMILDRHRDNVAASQLGFEWWFFNGLQQPITQSLFANDERLNDIGILDSGYLLVADAVGRVTVVDPENASPIATFRTGQGDILDLEVLDPNQFVTCGADGSVAHYKLSFSDNGELSHRLIRRISVCAAPLESLAINEKDGVIWVGDGKAQLYCIRLDNGKVTPVRSGRWHRRIKDLEFHRQCGLIVANQNVAFTLDVKSLHSNPGDHDATGLSELASFPATMEMIRDVELSSNGSTIAVVQLKGLLSVFNTEKPTRDSQATPVIRSHRIANDLHSVAIDSTGRWIAAGDSLGHIHLFESQKSIGSNAAENQEELLRLVQSWKPHEGKIEKLQFLDGYTTDPSSSVEGRPSILSLARDGRLLVSHLFSGRSLEFHSASGNNRQTRSARAMHTWAALALNTAWSPLEELGGTDHSCLMLARRSQGSASTLFLVDEKRLVATDGSVLWTAGAGERAVQFAGNGDASMVAICIESPTPRRHRLELYLAGESMPRWTLPSRLANALVFSPTGDRLAYVYNNDIRVVTTLDGSLERVLVGHTDSIQDLAFDKSGHQLASVSSDRTLKVWDMETGQTNWSRVAHRNRADAVAFHPFLKTIATVGEDQLVRFWTNSELEAGDDARLVAEFPLSQRSPQRLRFSEDGQSLFILHTEIGVSRLHAAMLRH